jgi:hypothetical protein
VEQVSRSQNGTAPTVIEIGISEQQQESGQKERDDTDRRGQAGEIGVVLAAGRSDAAEGCGALSD